jgi:hypothetical protein
MSEIDCGEKKCFGWLLSPVVFVAALFALLVAWALTEPACLIKCFDAGGRSPFELATLPFFAAIIPLVWWKCPFEGSLARKRILSSMVTIVVIMAILKQLDLHNAILGYFYPEYIGADGSLVPGKLVRPNGKPLGGTPFKMRVITNCAVPFGMKAMIVAYFGLFFGLFAAGFAYLFPTWLKGVFTLNPSAWAFGCFGASGVVVQISDRLPSWIRSSCPTLMRDVEGEATSARSLCTALEEGGEMMIAIFALMTIYLSYRALSKRVK